jgi:acetyl-CoA acetyltransferase
MFRPGFDPPYTLAVVALDEAPAVRLTTNLVGLGDTEARVGQRVRVQFHEQDGVWFPLFAPIDEPDAPIPGLVPPPVVVTRPPASTERFEHKVAITGIGMSQVGRRLLRAPLSLTVEACRNAIADAGLELSDIDGISTWPGAMNGAGGFTEGGTTALEEALHIHPTWHCGGIEMAGQAGSIINAMLAVASGLARHVLCFRTVWEGTHSQYMRTGELAPPGGNTVSGDFAFRYPFGAASAANWIAMQASQYFVKYGAGRETLGWIAVNARANAARNPIAIYRDPMTMDDYLSARIVSTPFGLYDCDVPCDAATAIIVSAKEAALDLRQPVVLVDAVGTQVTERPSWEQGTMTHMPGVFGAGAHLWSRASLDRSDVDVAEIYDGFSFNCLTWLEALGFCGVGEAADFLDGGKRIALDGDLPLNTHGGQLSAGRTHGYGFVHEAVTQLRGHAGERQVADARVAVAAVGGGLPGGCMLLTAG